MDVIVDFPQTRASYYHHNKRRAVSFNDQFDVKVVENLSCKHRDNLWFSTDEMHSFRYQAALAVHRITSAMTMAEFAELHIKDTSAFLGLESYMSKNTLRDIKHRRECILLVVLKEQGRQSRSGIYDSDALARASQAVSDLSTRRARIIGMIHAEKK